MWAELSVAKHSGGVLVIQPATWISLDGDSSDEDNKDDGFD